MDRNERPHGSAVSSCTRLLGQDTEISIALRLESASILEQVFELAGFLQVLQVGVAADMLLLDVNVGDGTLARDLLESILQGRTIRKLVELVSLEHGTELGQGVLGGAAVRAVGLGEDDDSILLDDLLNLGASFGHGLGCRSRKGRVESRGNRLDEVEHEVSGGRGGWMD